MDYDRSSDEDGGRNADKSEADEAAALLAAVIKAVSDEGLRGAERQPPLFFPKGIDLISLEFKVGTAVNIALRISGEACCKGVGGSSHAESTSLYSASLAEALPAAAADFQMGGSISERVNEAVTDQLVADGHWPPNDLTAVMETDYNYGRIAMRNFLASVRQTLSEGPDPLTFSFDNAFVLAALPMAVAELMAAIEEKTS